MAEWRAHWRAVREHRMVERKSTHFLNRVKGGSRRLDPASSGPDNYKANEESGA